MRPTARAALFLAIPLLGGCRGWQSALDTHGPVARSLETLFWIFLAVLAAVWVLTMLAVLLSLKARRAAEADPLASDLGRERRMSAVVSVAVGLTLAIVVALTGLSYAAQKELFSSRDGGLSLTVK